MSKRGAGSYLTDQNWDQEEENEEAGSFTQASSDQIAKRQIRKAKRRGVQGENTASEGLKSSAGPVFKGFTGFTGMANNANSASTAPGFSFGENKPLSFLTNGSSAHTASNTQSAGSSLFKTNDSDAKQAKETDSSKSNVDKSAVTSGGSNGAKKSSNRCKYLQQLRALNVSVTKWIQKHVEKNSSCILTPIFRDYEKHLAEIESKYPENDSSPRESEAKVTMATEASKSTATEQTIKSSSSSEQISSTSGFSFSTASPKDASNTKTETPNSKPAFSFGLAAASSSSGPNFSLASTTTLSSSSASESKPSLFGNVSSGESKPSLFGNVSSGESKPSLFGNVSGGSTLKPFSFAVGATKPAESAAAKKDEEEEYVPPKTDVVEVHEEGSLYTKRCKLFYQKDGNWLEKGVGNLHLKKLGDKTQVVIRADTNLGNILLNIMLTESLPIKRQGKNNVSLICVPNPPLDPKDDSKKPVSMLLRVKTSEDADELEKKMNELKK